MSPSIIRAGFSNMFLSDVFTDAFVNATNVPVALYHTDGSVGAAIGAGIGSGAYKNAHEAFSNFKPIKVVEPTREKLFNELYLNWRNALEKYL